MRERERGSAILQCYTSCPSDRATDDAGLGQGGTACPLHR